MVLAARCDKLRAMFYSSPPSSSTSSSSYAFRESHAAIINLTHPWSPAVFHAFLRYCYTGSGPPLGYPDLQEVVELLVLADEHLCPRLRQQCEHVLGASLDESSVEDAIQLCHSLGTQGLPILEGYCRVILSSLPALHPLRQRHVALLLPPPEIAELLASLAHSPCLDTGALPPSQVWVGGPFAAPLENAISRLTYADLPMLLHCPSTLHASRGVGRRDAVAIGQAWARTCEAWRREGKKECLPNADLLRHEMTQILHSGEWAIIGSAPGPRLMVRGGEEKLFVPKPMRMGASPSPCFCPAHSLPLLPSSFELRHYLPTHPPPDLPPLCSYFRCPRPRGRLPRGGG